MDKRPKQILAAIIHQFIETAEPVGSNAIIVRYHFKVSPATMRNEMFSLEQKGLIYQPHTSAGRVPTTLGYRTFINELADFEKARIKAKKTLTQVFETYRLEKAREKIYDIVSILSEASQNVSFATLPDNKRTFFLGLSHVLKQPEFSRDPINASRVIEVLENNDNFINILKSLNIDQTVKIFVGEENILENIKSCSLIVTKYQINGAAGFLGILGPTRMDYALNSMLIEEIMRILS